MAALTVFLAPDGAASGVQDVLRDLSTAGLVAPFLWVRESTVLAARDSGGRLPALSVLQGRPAETSLMAALTADRYDRVRLCSLIPLTGGEQESESPAEPELATRLRAAAGHAHIVQVRCLLAVPGDTGPQQVLGRDGWHNVLVSPEDARGPGEAHALLPRTTGPVDLARHVGPVLAALLGLWTGMSSSCLDDRPVPPARQVRLVRAFFRRIDASEVELHLRERTLTTTTTPLPLEHGSAAAHTPDPAEACDAMVTALCRKHPEVLPRSRAEVAQATTERIGWRQTVSWFFGFLWAALRNAPEEWFLAKKRQVAGVVARSVQGTVFGGSASAYRVIVNQMGPEGRPAAWYDLQQASEKAVELMTGRPQHAAADLSELWRDFAAGALTLVDGGARDRTMPPIRVGNRLGVLRAAVQSVPDGGGDFTVSSAQVQARTDTRSVQASDVIGAGEFRTRLAALAADPRVRDAGPTLAAFDDWQRVHARTYSVRLGQVLARGIDLTLGEIRTYVGLLEQLDAERTDDDELAQHRRFGRRTRIVTLGALAALLVVGGLWLVGWADGSTALIIAGVVGLAWAATGVLNFVESQRALFQALTRQNVLPSQQEAIGANLREALEDLQRLSEAYGQFLVWSKVVGAVLQQPFGTMAPTDDRRVIIRRGLPLSTALGHAQVDDAQLAEVAAELRRGLFTSSWLSSTWDAAVSQAAALLGPRGHELGEAEHAIFAEPSGPGSLLEEWAEVVVREQPFAVASGNRMWQFCMDRLDTAPDGAPALSERLLVRVVPDDAAAGASMSRGLFMAGVDDPHFAFTDGDDDPAGGRRGGAGFEPPDLLAVLRFDSASLSVAASGSTALTMDDAVLNEFRTGLSRTAVLVQLGAPAPAWTFAVCAPETLEPEHVTPLGDGSEVRF